MMMAAINVKMCREEMAKTLLICSSKHWFVVMAMDACVV